MSLNLMIPHLSAPPWFISFQETFTGNNNDNNNNNKTITTPLTLGTITLGKVISMNSLNSYNYMRQGYVIIFGSPYGKTVAQVVYEM